MTKAARERQRENRRKKRRLCVKLKAQADNNKCTEGIGKDILLNIDFNNYAITETLQEIKSKNIDKSRIALIDKVISTKEKLNPAFRNIKNKSNKITVLSSAFEMGKHR